MINKSALIALLFAGFLIYSCNYPVKSESKIKPKEASTDMPENVNDHPVTKEDSAKWVSTTLTVMGDVQFPLSLTVDSLKKMSVIGLDSFNVVCQSGAVTSGNIRSRGILLKEILEKALIRQTNHQDRNFYIVARASDGYKATFSWAELFNNPTGENVYVIFEENGQPIINKGAMILNCTNDIKTGPRHVIWLKSIEVKRVD
ncbi:MAG: molybdopterin-dependent oxidoreductase [Chitinophagaceae bacterium]|nr:molybdopterin-dependent oxidoreductase [Chitinophagaceae bacterium]